MRASVTALLALTLIPIVPSSGQQSPPADANAPEVTSHEGTVTFSSKVNLVSVPVVVRDAQGRPVGNLKQEDFQLFDKGKLQTITRFSIETTEAPVIEPGSPTPTNPQAKPTPAKPTLPERYVAYLVDDIHLQRGDLMQTRRAVDRHLDEALEPNSRAAIFTTSGRMMSDFTADREKLHKAVDSILPWSSGPDAKQDCPSITYYQADYLANKSLYFSGFLFTDFQIAGFALNGTDQILTAVVYEAQACTGTQLQLPPASPPNTLPPDVPLIRTVRTAVHQALEAGNRDTSFSLGALKDIVRKMSAMPGTRTIVLVSPGFIMTSDYRTAENDVFDSAIRANVTVNTIDMRGLYALPGFDASERGPSSQFGGTIMQAAIAEASQADDVLGELADATGGTFFHNDNGLKTGLNLLAARPEIIYVLGFSPQDLKYDGSFHTLKVKVGNLRNVSLQVRRGYWSPNHAENAAEQAKDEIREAVFSSEEIQDIPVVLQTEFFRLTDEKTELTVTGHVDGSTLQFRKAGDRNNDTVTVVAGLFDSSGNYVSGIQRVVELRLRDQTLAGLQRSGITVKEVFNVAPGRYIVRMVVRDGVGKTMAARNQGIEIP
jgi:VWFA-related protein